MSDQILISLVGNPNCGKTTAFNAYTGARQHVGNYPGITVEKKQGSTTIDGEKVTIVDLPGTYSLTAYSQEELVTRTVLAEENPLAVVDIVDASALERNLFLTVQIMEMGLPVALALNMMDEARKAGIRIQVQRLSERLGIPVVETVARSGEGLEEVMRQAIRHGREHTENRKALSFTYGTDLDPALEKMEAIIEASGLLKGRYTPRWVALKLLEGDTQVLLEAHRASASTMQQLQTIVDETALHIRQTLGTTPEAIIADYRYGFIKGILHDGVLEQNNTNARLALTDKLDTVLTNTLLGPVIGILILLGIFYVTFEIGAFPQEWVEEGFEWLGEAVGDMMEEGPLQSLLSDGLIAGVGAVLSFVPLILIIFLFIAFLEDSGYMARVAYMLDRIFRAFGLHGNSVMPFIISGGIPGGCAIPGVMATRTLRSPKEKLATILTLPYMTCGAKLPVFLLIAGVFFPGSEAITLLWMTLAGWAVALFVALLLRNTLVKGEPTPFVMELPPYRMPTLRSVCIHAWERTWQYIKKAGTVIVAVTIIIWASMTFPGLDDELAAPFDDAVAQIEEQLEALADDAPEREALEEQIEEIESERASVELRNSYAGMLGTAIEPFTLPAGFDWRTDIALIGGIAAKEAIVSTLGTAYSLGEQDPEDAQSLAELLSNDPGWSKATAVALMLFVLLYSPCFVALAVIRNETGSWFWAAFSLVFNTALAYGVAVCAYQIGRSIWG